MLVALVVMVPLVLGAATGLLTAVRASAAAHEEQRLQLALGNAAEQLRTLPYEPCSTPEELQQRFQDVHPVAAATRTDPSARSAAGRNAGELPARVTRVDHWSTAAGRFLDRCTPDEGAQRVTFTVSDGDRSATASVVTRLGEPRRGPAR